MFQIVLNSENRWAVRMWDQLNLAILEGSNNNCDGFAPGANCAFLPPEKIIMSPKKRPFQKDMSSCNC